MQGNVRNSRDKSFTNDQDSENLHRKKTSDEEFIKSMSMIKIVNFFKKFPIY